MELIPGKIYLADQRGLTETQVLRRYSTFNFENYYNEHKEPFGNLFLCNDESIIGGKITFFLCKENSLQVFIPITGGIDLVANGKEFAVDTGQIQVLNMGKGEVLGISNPYQNDMINYIQFGIKTDMFLMRASEMLFDFDFEQNHLIEIIANTKLPFKLSAGIFAGREEVIYKLQSPNHQLYTFIIDGAFEIEGRLMHARDGLALWNIEQVELEALSNNAIVFVLELGF
ncbi:pirin family protein [Pedobacter terrae]|uniref:pirin family protein n=1 Tax=Pedobacter terrae TaxID=405671 RepID=UPI002FFB6930